MEAVDLRMEELFDTDAVDDGDLGAMAPMPDLDDDDGPMRQEGENEDDDGEVNEDVLNRLKDLKGAAKKRVMRPQPKLDVDRLKGSRGLPELSSMFEKTKFKGKGHEADDIRLMMGKLEHWAHRLFPKMTFDEFIDRLERLGQKKPLQTCVRKIRLGMPLLEDDIIQQAEGEQEAQSGEEGENEVPQDDDIDAEEAFEEMLRKEKENRQLNEAKKSNDGADSSLAASGGDLANKPALDQQTEAEILAALDSDEDWDECDMDTQCEQKKQTENSNSDELNLRLTATEATEESAEQDERDGKIGVTKDSMEPSLNLHLTPTEQKSTENSSQNTNLKLQLTESEAVNSEPKSKQDSDSEDNLDLHISESEPSNKEKDTNKDAADKNKKVSTSDEQEGNELVLNLSTSDSEMTADES